MNYKIPFHRPIEIPFSKKELNGMLSNDKYTRELEQQIKNLYDVEHVIACSSNSIGMLITLQAFQKIYGLEYIATPAFAWFSSKWAIESTKDVDLIFTDVNRETWLMNPSLYWITLPIHTFGSVCLDSSQQRIYDGAHALGSKITDFGKATIMSLAPSKLITACEGGLILTNDNDLAIEIIALRDKVSRMSELNAIWGLETLKYLDDVLKWKKKCYAYYKNKLPGKFQEIPHDSNYNTIGFLTEMKMPPEIQFKKYYVPLRSGFTNTNYLYGKIVCLPSWYGVDCEYIVNKILGFNERFKK